MLIECISLEINLLMCYIVLEQSKFNEITIYLHPVYAMLNE